MIRKELHYMIMNWQGGALVDTNTLIRALIEEVTVLSEQLENALSKDSE